MRVGCRLRLLSSGVNLSLLFAMPAPINMHFYYCVKKYLHTSRGMEIDGFQHYLIVLEPRLDR
jgi:hypothetical protein